MPSKLETFLATKKIDRRQLVTVSRALEKLRPEDRAIRLAKRQGAKAEDGDKAKGAEKRKPRSGKPISNVALGKIYEGKEVSGPTRTRVLRAVNAILERKKQEKVDLTALFEYTPGTGSKKKDEPAETPAS